MIHQNKYKMEMEKHLLCLEAGLKFQWFLLLQDISIIMEEEEVGFPAGAVRKMIVLVVLFFAILV